MSHAAWMLLGIACVIVAIKWAIRTAKYEPREAFDQAYEDARLDTIRDELEQQTAPNRPHIRSVQ